MNAVRHGRPAPCCQDRGGRSGRDSGRNCQTDNRLHRDQIADRNHRRIDDRRSDRADARTAGGASSNRGSAAVAESKSHAPADDGNTGSDRLRINRDGDLGRWPVGGGQDRSRKLLRELRGIRDGSVEHQPATGQTPVPAQQQKAWFSLSYLLNGGEGDEEGYTVCRTVLMRGNGVSKCRA